MTKAFYYCCGINQTLPIFFKFVITIDSLEEILNVNFFPTRQFRDIEYVESRVDERDWR